MLPQRTRRGLAPFILCSFAIGLLCGCSDDSPSTGGASRLDTPCRARVAPGTDPLIDAMNDNDPLIAPGGNRAGSWYVFNDGTGPQDPPADLAQTSEECVAQSGNYVSPVRDGQACTQGGPFTDWGAGLGVGLNEGSGCKGCNYDASVYQGVEFVISGTANVDIFFGVTLGATTDVEWGGSCASNDCLDSHGFNLQVTPTAVAYQLAWGDLAQGGWGTVMPFDPRQIQDLQWSITPTSTEGAEFSICVDDVSFF